MQRTQINPKSASTSHGVATPTYHQRPGLRFGIVLIGTLWLAACTSINVPAQLAGHWESEGYGRVLAISTNKVEVYDRARNTCVKADAIALELRSILESSQFVFLDDASQVDVSFANEPYKLRFNRLDQLPPVCVEPTANTPPKNFEAFTNYFAEHYAFLELFSVDWEQRTNAARLQVTEQTSDAELFTLFSRLLEPLQDAHINLFGFVGGKEITYGPEQSPLRKALDAQASAEQVPVGQLQQALLTALWEGNIGARILGGKGTSAANGLIQYGVVANTNGSNLGYLAVQREAGYGRDGDTLALLNQVLDAAITQWQQTKVARVVIDLAVNFGGSDYVSRAIANRFAAKRTLAYRKRAADRVNAIDFDLYLEPHAGLQFTGPVTLLTSATTVSAGEILAMSLRSLPNVTHIGEPTRGSLSDILDKTLPNGWTVTLSNEIYTDHQGQLWEGPGITPHRSITVLDPQDPVASHLKAIQTAINWTDLPPN